MEEHDQQLHCDNNNNSDQTAGESFKQKHYPSESQISLHSSSATRPRDGLPPKYVMNNF